MIQATRKSVCAIIPAFGEARFIGTVVCGILEHVDHVIVVDDYSPDQTTTVAREAGAEVIRHSENLGKGAAIKTGLHKVADNYRYFLFLDGDGSPWISDRICADRQQSQENNHRVKLQKSSRRCCSTINSAAALIFLSFVIKAVA
jgi:glycosyltransferase involved in cell wall biosynthesis